VHGVGAAGPCVVVWPRVTAAKAGPQLNQAGTSQAVALLLPRLLRLLRLLLLLPAACR
jgi:hypothetical protein